MALLPPPPVGRGLIRGKVRRLDAHMVEELASGDIRHLTLRDIHATIIPLSRVSLVIYV